jgi:hypothetical protein
MLGTGPAGRWGGLAGKRQQDQKSKALSPKLRKGLPIFKFPFLVKWQKDHKIKRLGSFLDYFQ